MNSPHLFCTAHLVNPVDETPYKAVDGKPTLIGNLCSSIHRLKESIDNSENGFFIFSDLSVTVLGTWKLMFTVFDLDKDPMGSSGQVRKLCSICSNPFRVATSKDYKGLLESTYMTRHFSEQGVRLRLRKEPRQATKRKITQDDASILQDKACGAPILA
jgi:hypothetical protein